MSYINERDKKYNKLENWMPQNTPDLPMDVNTKKKFFDIVKACQDEGLDGFEYIFEFFTWEEISELAAYSGFPVRYPHYLFGMEFEHLNQSYKYGFSKIYEMVCNSDPCYAYLLSSNSDVDNATVIAHAYAHNDFFKNNVWFSGTNRNMINDMANHGNKIRRYCQRYGRDTVIRFLDLVLSIQFLIDPDDVFKGENSRWKEVKFEDEINTEEPRKIKVEDGHEYMDDFINPKEWIDKERERIKKDFEKRMNKFPENPTRDILGFIAQNSPRLRNWMRDIMFMIREESLYFVPQIQTKVINEGWASYWDEIIMAKRGFAGDEGIVEYAKHHAGVLGGKYSRNPYAVGNMLLKYIKERWDKGQFGKEWDECKDRKTKDEWDKKLGLGTEKIFELRKIYNDNMLIQEFLDQDFCDKNEFYVYERNEEGEYILVSRDAEDVKASMLESTGMNRFPVIKVTDANCLNLGHIKLEHSWTGRTLSMRHAKEVIKHVARLWGRPAVITTYEIGENYDPSIPMEYNDEILPIALFSHDGKDVIVGEWKDYEDRYTPQDNDQGVVV